MSAPAPGPQLRDIHLPPAPAWWPPAPGWWILAAVAIVLLVLAARWLLRNRRQRRWRKRIHAELERIAATHASQPQTAVLAATLSQLLRRVARVIEPMAVTLRDEDWLAFLDRQLPPARAASEPFRTGIGRVLVDAPYRRLDDPTLQALDARALLDLARGWLSAALPRKRDHA